MRTGVCRLLTAAPAVLRKMQRFPGVDTLIVVDDAGRYANWFHRGHPPRTYVVTNHRSLFCLATVLGDDAKGCFEQLISSGASYLVVLGEAEQVEGIITKTSMASAMAEQLWG